MKWYCVWFALGVGTLGCGQLGFSQTPPAAANGQFQDLAQKASAMLGSDPREAIALSKQALALNPSWAEGWFNIGAAAYQLSDYPQAEQALTHAAELAPDKGAVWAFLGLAQYRLGKQQPALRSFEKGEQLGLPDNRGFIETVRNCAALVLIRADNYTGAVEQLRPLAQLGDDSPATIQTFGMAALGISRPAPDQKDLVQLAGKTEWALSANRAAEAEQNLKQLLAKYPTQSGVHYLNGIALVAHDPEAARKEFQRELELNPASVPARLQIAILDIRAGDPQKAIHPGTEAVRMQPDNALAHAVLGRAQMQAEHYAAALPELLAASRLAPMNPQLHLYLEQVYTRLGKTTEAQTEKAEFIRLHSSAASPAK